MRDPWKKTGISSPSPRVISSPHHPSHSPASSSHVMARVIPPRHPPTSWRASSPRVITPSHPPRVIPRVMARGAKPSRQDVRQAGNGRQTVCPRSGKSQMIMRAGFAGGLHQSVARQMRIALRGGYIGVTQQLFDIIKRHALID